MTFIYDILGVPFGFVLRFFDNLIQLMNDGVGNYGLAIIALTIFARLLMIPSSISQQKGMAKTQRMQAKLRKIQTKYAGNQQKIQEETTALYQREGVNPMGAGCGPMLLQFIPLFGLLGAIYYPLSHFLSSSEINEGQIEVLKTALLELAEAGKISVKSASEKSIYNELYIVMNIDAIAEHLKNTGVAFSESVIDSIRGTLENGRWVGGINLEFFGINLGYVPMEHKDIIIKNAAGKSAINWETFRLWLVPVCSFLSSMASGVYSMIRQKKNSNSAAPGGALMTGCMTFGLPLFSLYWVITLPAAIGVYWTASSLCGFVSTLVLGYFYSPKKVIAKLMVEETIERRSKEKHIKSITEIKEKKN